MRKLSLAALLCVLAGTATAQPGTVNNLSKWTSSTVLGNSLLKDNAATVSLGNYFGTPPAAYMMHFYETGPANHTIGLDVELFSRAVSGTSKGVVTNIQGSNTNVGFDAFTQNGSSNYGGSFTAQNGSSYNNGVTAVATGGSMTVGGNFTGSNGSNNSGIQALSHGGTGCTGGGFSATNAQLAHGVTSTANSNGIPASEAIGGLFIAGGGQKNYGATFMSSGNTANIDNYGAMISADKQNPGKNYGIDVSAQGLQTTTENYGVHIHALANNSVLNFGVYSVLNGGSSGSYSGFFRDWNFPGSGTGAAYFDGTVYCTSSPVIVSDRQFKENISPVTGALEKVMQLKPSTYTFKGRDQYPSFSFPAGKQYGFISQELEQVIPELVEDGVNPPAYDKDKKKIADEVTYKGVSYTELIPVVVGAIQDQQKLIAQKDALISNLEERLQRLEAAQAATGLPGTNTDAVLFQNTPNPFSTTTEIRYRFGAAVQQGVVMIFDMNGKQIRTIPLQGHEGAVMVSAAEMAAGMYLYSLLLDGQEAVTKRMVISK